MFGNNDNQQSTMGAPTTQSPSMLDNVSAQDFGDENTPARSPTSPVIGNPQPTHTSQPAQTSQPAPAKEPEHPITTDNPFNPTPASAKSSYTPSPNLAASTPKPAQQPTTDNTKPPVISTHSSPSIQPSGPVAPPSSVTPAPLPPADDTKKDEDTPKPADTTASSVPSVDVEKLAGMKQQALEHLEPLVGQLGQKPEDEFKTTMMMIQANDNHTLLGKALDAAKKISDDKERAQAMLDIINEINYFSQPKEEE